MLTSVDFCIRSRMRRLMASPQRAQYICMVIATGILILVVPMLRMTFREAVHRGDIAMKALPGVSFEQLEEPDPDALVDHGQPLPPDPTLDEGKSHDTSHEGHLAWPAAAKLQSLGCTALPEDGPGLPVGRFKMLLHACMPPENLRIGHLKLDADGHKVISETPLACPLYFLAGASVTFGTAVEFGTFAGASMRCIAAGLNLTGRAGRAYGFDAFHTGLIKTNLQKLVDGAGQNRFSEEISQQGENFDLKKLFYFYTRDVYPSIQAVTAHFLKTSARDMRKGFENRQLDVWSTDSAKKWEDLARQLKIVSQYLEVGSLIILADFYQTQGNFGQAPYIYHHFIQGEDFKSPEVTGKINYLELLATVDTHAVFGVLKPLPRIPTEMPMPGGGNDKLWKRVYRRAATDAFRVKIAGFPSAEPLLKDVFGPWMHG